MVIKWCIWSSLKYTAFSFSTKLQLKHNRCSHTHTHTKKSVKIRLKTEAAQNLFFPYVHAQVNTDDRKSPLFSNSPARIESRAYKQGEWPIQYWSVILTLYANSSHLRLAVPSVQDFMFKMQEQNRDMSQPNHSDSGQTALPQLFYWMREEG